jgi:hypothetical protein
MPPDAGLPFASSAYLWEIAGSAKKDHIVQFADIDAWVRGERRGEAAAANLCFQA